MFNVLNFIWSKVRSVKKQRLLVCDEAWIMLQNDISANFLFGLIKRARKFESIDEIPRELRKAIHISINGLATGLRNSG